MKAAVLIVVLTWLTMHTVFAQPALTIYNQNFAVVRDAVPLDLQSGVNTIRYANATAQVEPDSVILLDPTSQHSLQILEQNYRNDPVSQELLLSLLEGKTIDFEKRRTKDNIQVDELIPGKIIRSGYVPGGNPQQPIIEINGKPPAARSRLEAAQGAARTEGTAGISTDSQRPRRRGMEAVHERIKQREGERPSSLSC